MNYLRQFGYLNSNSSSSIAKAIRDFQTFSGLDVTGRLDAETLNLMNKPRCGVKDKIGHMGARRKRYAHQGSKWNVNDLAYRISKYPKRLNNKELVDREIAKALKVWSDVTNINFINHEKEHVDLVHIDIRFEEGDHGDGMRFDGRGHTLAHAFFPHCGSDAHFDDTEEWTIDDKKGTNLFQVAVHEFGHTLGLDHSDIRNSVMAPFHSGNQAGKRLNRDDILSIQALYGRPNRAPPIMQIMQKLRGNPDPNGPDLCKDPSLDAATTVQDGRAFVFKGNHYWEIEETGIVDGPRKISDDWDGMPGNIDAAMTWTNGKTYFFKNDVYYRFRNQDMDPGYPKSIQTEFKGIPNNIDTAFVWSGNGKAYFFKGDIYWRFDNCKDPPILSYYPLYVNGWKGLPNNIDAALQWGNQKTYFFKGREYFRFNDKTAVVDERFSTSDVWLHCNSKWAF
ncbi:hypothetical protein JTE90_027454 [Oedothorax gibbosus]|uniref:Peptidase metallopeptidase domain-containing protein n=1 Tax=Oedothorax gibbosus TaxID=931172 RepID=A0AAV6VZE3_9ARAC|nr:hypothetical protein JTE90_027454 [Oedothorax gibbosus]